MRKKTSFSALSLVVIGKSATAILLFVLCAGIFSCQTTSDFAVSATKGNGYLPQKEYFSSPRYVLLDDTNPQAVLKHMFPYQIVLYL